MKKLALLLVLSLCSIQITNAQLGGIVTVLKNSSKQIYDAKNIPTSTELTVKNIGTVPVKIYAAAKAGDGPCVCPSDVNINPGESVTKTLQELGAVVGLREIIKVINETGTPGTIQLPAYQPCTGPAVDAWYTNGDDGGGGVIIPGTGAGKYAIYLCNGYERLGIGTVQPSYPLDVAGNAHVGGDFNLDGYLNGDIEATGNIGIGAPASSSYKLSVNGKIHAREVVIDEMGWPDYVFAKKYKLMSLNELEAFIHKNKHLPQIPAAKEIEENGVGVAEMLKLQMQKIEELTLYIIEQNKRIEQLEKENQTKK